MPTLKNLKKRHYIFLLLISIVLSGWIAISPNFEYDQIGALANIYLPYFVGIISIIIFLPILMTNREKLTYYVLCCLIVVNLTAGLILYFNFGQFGKELDVFHTANSTVTDAQFIKATNDRVVIEDANSYPTSKGAVFSYSYNPNYVTNRSEKTNHNWDVVILKVKNLRHQSLLVKQALFAHKDLWDLSITNSNNRQVKLPLSVSAGDSVFLNIRFTAAAINNRVKPFWWKAVLKFQNWIVGFGRDFNYQPSMGRTCSNISSQLNVVTNDDVTPVKAIRLDAVWEYGSENDWEPGIQMILNTLHFKTRVGFTYFDNGLKGDSVIKGTDEVTADYFEPADPNLPVSFTKIAAYHGCCVVGDADTLAVYYKADNVIENIETNDQHSGQMLLPKTYPIHATKPVATPSAPFAIKIGSSYTDRKMNFGHKIGIRVWKAVDEFGNVIPSTYIFGSDYLGKKGTNYDYQDNVYLLQNIKRHHHSKVLFSENVIKIK